VAAAGKNGNKPSGYTKCREFIDFEPVSFSRRTLLHGVSKYVTVALKWLSQNNLVY
jgi:hypothetical protein